MQLDKFSDYALRILMVLTVKRPQSASVRQIADIFDISETHVAKIATALARDGYIVSRRGRAGGLRLAMAPSEMSVGQVLRKIKAGTPVVECFDHRKSCKIMSACGLRGPLQEAQEAFFATLDRYSLEDLTRQGADLRQLIA